MSLIYKAHFSSVYVEITGESLKRLKLYLERFWQYYNSSPQIQNILATA